MKRWRSMCDALSSVSPIRLLLHGCLERWSGGEACVMHSRQSPPSVSYYMAVLRDEAVEKHVWCTLISLPHPSPTTWLSWEMKRWRSMCDALSSVSPIRLLLHGCLERWSGEEACVMHSRQSPPSVSYYMAVLRDEAVEKHVWCTLVSLPHPSPTTWLSWEMKRWRSMCDALSSVSPIRLLLHGCLERWSGEEACVMHSRQSPPSVSCYMAVLRDEAVKKHVWCTLPPSVSYYMAVLRDEAVKKHVWCTLVSLPHPSPTTWLSWEMKRWRSMCDALSTVSPIRLLLHGCLERWSGEEACVMHSRQSPPSVSYYMAVLRDEAVKKHVWCTLVSLPHPSPTTWLSWEMKRWRSMCDALSSVSPIRLLLHGCLERWSGEEACVMHSRQSPPSVSCYMAVLRDEAVKKHVWCTLVSLPHPSPTTWLSWEMKRWRSMCDALSSVSPIRLLLHGCLERWSGEEACVMHSRQSPPSVSYYMAVLRDEAVEKHVWCTLVSLPHPSPTTWLSWEMKRWRSMCDALSSVSPIRLLLHGCLERWSGEEACVMHSPLSVSYYMAVLRDEAVKKHVWCTLVSLPHPSPTTWLSWEMKRWRSMCDALSSVSPIRLLLHCCLERWSGEEACVIDSRQSPPSVSYYMAVLRDEAAKKHVWCTLVSLPHPSPTTWLSWEMKRWRSMCDALSSVSPIRLLLHGCLERWSSEKACVMHSRQSLPSVSCYMAVLRDEAVEKHVWCTLVSLPHPSPATWLSWEMKRWRSMCDALSSVSPIRLLLHGFLERWSGEEACVMHSRQSPPSVSYYMAVLRDEAVEKHVWCTLVSLPHPSPTTWLSWEMKPSPTTWLSWEMKRRRSMCDALSSVSPIRLLLHGCLERWSGEEACVMHSRQSPPSVSYYMAVLRDEAAKKHVWCTLVSLPHPSPTTWLSWEMKRWRSMCDALSSVSPVRHLLHGCLQRWSGGEACVMHSPPSVSYYMAVLRDEAVEKHVWCTLVSLPIRLLLHGCLERWSGGEACVMHSPPSVSYYMAVLRDEAVEKHVWCTLVSLPHPSPTTWLSWEMKRWRSMCDALSSVSPIRLLLHGCLERWSGEEACVMHSRQSPPSVSYYMAVLRDEAVEKHVWCTLVSLPRPSPTTWLSWEMKRWRSMCDALSPVRLLLHGCLERWSGEEACVMHSRQSPPSVSYYMAVLRDEAAKKHVWCTLVSLPHPSPTTWLSWEMKRRRSMCDALSSVSPIRLLLHGCLERWSGGEACVMHSRQSPPSVSYYMAVLRDEAVEKLVWCTLPRPSPTTWLSWEMKRWRSMCDALSSVSPIRLLLHGCLERWSGGEACVMHSPPSVSYYMAVLRDEAVEKHVWCTLVSLPHPSPTTWLSWEMKRWRSMCDALSPVRLLLHGCLERWSGEEACVMHSRQSPPSVSYYMAVLRDEAVEKHVWCTLVSLPHLSPTTWLSWEMKRWRSMCDALSSVSPIRLLLHGCLERWSGGEACVMHSRQSPPSVSYYMAVLRDEAVEKHVWCTLVILPHPSPTTWLSWEMKRWRSMCDALSSVSPIRLLLHGCLERWSGEEACVMHSRQSPPSVSCYMAVLRDEAVKKHVWCTLVSLPHPSPTTWLSWEMKRWRSMCDALSSVSPIRLLLHGCLERWSGEEACVMHSRQSPPSVSYYMAVLRDEAVKKHVWCTLVSLPHPSPTTWLSWEMKRWRSMCDALSTVSPIRLLLHGCLERWSGGEACVMHSRQSPPSVSYYMAVLRDEAVKKHVWCTLDSLPHPSPATWLSWEMKRWRSMCDALSSVSPIRLLLHGCLERWSGGEACVMHSRQSPPSVSYYMAVLRDEAVKKHVWCTLVSLPHPSPTTWLSWEMKRWRSMCDALSSVSPIRLLLHGCLERWSGEEACVMHSRQSPPSVSYYMAVLRDEAVKKHVWCTLVSLPHPSPTTWLSWEMKRWRSMFDALSSVSPIRLLLHGCLERWSGEEACLMHSRQSSLSVSYYMAVLRDEVAKKHVWCTLVSLPHPSPTTWLSWEMKRWRSMFDALSSVSPIRLLLHGCLERWSGIEACVMHSRQSPPSVSYYMAVLRDEAAEKHVWCTLVSLPHPSPTTWLSWEMKCRRSMCDALSSVSPIRLLLHGCLERWSGEEACVMHSRQSPPSVSYYMAVLRDEAAKKHVWCTLVSLPHPSPTTWLSWEMKRWRSMCDALSSVSPVRHLLHGCLQRWSGGEACVMHSPPSVSYYMAVLRDEAVEKHVWCTLVSLPHPSPTTWLSWEMKRWRSMCDALSPVRLLLHGCLERWSGGEACVMHSRQSPPSVSYYMAVLRDEAVEKHVWCTLVSLPNPSPTTWLSWEMKRWRSMCDALSSVSPIRLLLHGCLERWSGGEACVMHSRQSPPSVSYYMAVLRDEAVEKHVWCTLPRPSPTTWLSWEMKRRRSMCDALSSVSPIRLLLHGCLERWSGEEACVMHSRQSPPSVSYYMAVLRDEAAKKHVWCTLVSLPHPSPTTWLSWEMKRWRSMCDALSSVSPVRLLLHGCLERWSGGEACVMHSPPSVSYYMAVLRDEAVEKHVWCTLVSLPHPSPTTWLSWEMKRWRSMCDALSPVRLLLHGCLERWSGGEACVMHSRQSPPSVSYYMAVLRDEAVEKHVWCTLPRPSPTTWLSWEMKRRRSMCDALSSVSPIRLLLHGCLERWSGGEACVMHSRQSPPSVSYYMAVLRDEAVKKHVWCTLVSLPHPSPTTWLSWEMKRWRSMCDALSSVSPIRLLLHGCLERWSGGEACVMHSRHSPPSVSYYMAVLRDEAVKKHVWCTLVSLPHPSPTTWLSWEMKRWRSMCDALSTVSPIRLLLHGCLERWSGEEACVMHSRQSPPSVSYYMAVLRDEAVEKHVWCTLVSLPHPSPTTWLSWEMKRWRSMCDALSSVSPIRLLLHGCLERWSGEEACVMHSRQSPPSVSYYMAVLRDEAVKKHVWCTLDSLPHPSPATWLSWEMKRWRSMCDALSSVSPIRLLLHGCLERWSGEEACVMHSRQSPPSVSCYMAVLRDEAVKKHVWCTLVSLPHPSPTTWLSWEMKRWRSMCDALSSVSPIRLLLHGCLERWSGEEACVMHSRQSPPSVSYYMAVLRDEAVKKHVWCTLVSLPHPSPTTWLSWEMKRWRSMCDALSSVSPIRLLLHGCLERWSGEEACVMHSRQSPPSVSYYMAVLRDEALKKHVWCTLVSLPHPSPTTWLSWEMKRWRSMFDALSSVFPIRLLLHGCLERWSCEEACVMHSRQSPPSISYYMAVLRDEAVKKHVWCTLVSLPYPSPTTWLSWEMKWHRSMCDALSSVSPIRLLLHGCLERWSGGEACVMHSRQSPPSVSYYMAVLRDEVAKKHVWCTLVSLPHPSPTTWLSWEMKRWRSMCDALSSVSPIRLLLHGCLERWSGEEACVMHSRQSPPSVSYYMAVLRDEAVKKHVWCTLVSLPHPSPATWLSWEMKRWRSMCDALSSVSPIHLLLHGCLERWSGEEACVMHSRQSPPSVSYYMAVLRDEAVKKHVWCTLVSLPRPSPATWLSWEMKRRRSMCDALSSVSPIRLLLHGCLERWSGEEACVMHSRQSPPSVSYYMAVLRDEAVEKHVWCTLVSLPHPSPTTWLSWEMKRWRSMCDALSSVSPIRLLLHGCLVNTGDRPNGRVL